MKVDHVTAIVGDCDGVAEVLTRLFGAQPVGKVQLPGMSIATFRIGNVELHVNSPNGPGPVDDHFRSRGAGLHHLAIAVDNLDEEMDRLSQRGFRVLGEPVQTAPGLREVFIDPALTGGIVIQLVERIGTDVRPSDLDADAIARLALKPPT